MKKLPIGISDFKKIIESNAFYIDKTLLIKELDEQSGDVLLFPRPRRFGKTLNMSMLRYFYEKTEQNHAYLFKNLAIEKEPEYMTQQGTYPVIFLSLREAKQSNWQEMYEKLVDILAKEIARHEYIIHTPCATITDDNRAQLMRLKSKTSSPVEYRSSIQFLSEMLSKFHQKNVIILLDEYDAPIHKAFYLNFYDPAVDFIRQLMEGAFKDNSFIHRGIITGILRTAKEGIFSGLNNLRICSILNESFSDKFGFTQAEVDILLESQKLTHLQDEIKAWYDGYMFGKTHMYNPWSLLMCTSERGELASHWGNTSNNNLIERIITTAPTDVSDQLQELINGLSINKKISEGMVFPGVESDSDAIWNLLLFTGYLTTRSYTGRTAEDKIYELAIPNKDVAIAYQERILSIMKNTLSDSKLKAFVSGLFKGDAALIASLLHDFIVNSTSVRDFTADDVERSYHTFILGLLCCYQSSIKIWSNRESGYGFYDLAIIPRKQAIQANDVGVIIELKNVGKDVKPENLDDALEKNAALALEQIKAREYTTELVDFGFKRVIAYGIACSGKKVVAQAQWVIGK